MKHFKIFFQAVLKSKTNVLSVWKRHISPVRKFLSDKFESIFWVSKTKLWNFFKSRDSRGKHFGKWFWCYLTWKANVLSVGKWSCFLFVNFWVAKFLIYWFLGKQSNAFKTFWFQSLSYEVFQKMVFKLPERAKRMFWMFGNGLTKLKMFSGKARQRLQKF